MLCIHVQKFFQILLVFFFKLLSSLTTWALEYVYHSGFLFLWSMLMNLFDYNLNSWQVIVVTDGSCGMGQGSLKHSLQTYNQRDSTDSKFPLPFPFPAKLHILCISNPGDSDLKASLPLYQKLIDINDQVGHVKLWAVCAFKRKNYCLSVCFRNRNT